MSGTALPVVRIHIGLLGSLARFGVPEINHAFGEAVRGEFVV